MKRWRPVLPWILWSVAGLALAIHWTQFVLARAGERAAGGRLVVFGPSSWDTLIPGGSAERAAPTISRLDAAFRKLHPEVGAIIHDSRGPVADGLARLRNAYVAGDPVDVVICAANPVNTSYARLGLITPMDDFVRRHADRFTADSIENFRVRGHVWAAPLSVVNISTFFYNRDLFDELKIPPPATDADFLATKPLFARRNVIPIIHQGKNAWMWTPWFYSALVQTSAGKHRAWLADILSGKAHFTDGKGVLALRLTRKWVDMGLLDPQSSELDEEGMKAMFLAGRAATFFGGTWDMPGIRERATFRWGIFPFPRIVEAAGAAKSFGGAEMGLCVARGSRRPDLARAYIEFLTRPENARALLLPQMPFATSERGVTGLPGEKEEALRAQLPAEKPLEWMMPPEVNEMMQRELQAMMAGAATPEQTAASMQARLDDLRASRAIGR